MGKKNIRRHSKFKTVSICTLLALGVIFTGIAFINLNLPSESPLIDKLTLVEQNRLAEVIHLRQTLGDEVWPGWGSYDIPILVYNEAYAFLVGMNEPEPGWIRVPYKTKEGGAWEKVNENETYHRQALPATGENPQAFIVEIGNVYAASMTTKDWTQIHLMQLIKEDLPNFLKPIMPYTLFINRFNSDWHIAGISHESFHAFQASVSYNRVKEAEKVNALGNSYPWQNSEFRADWVKERQLLAKAIIETNEKKMKQDVREWLAVRKKRRARLTPGLVHYEQEREWLEGLAKYAELKIWELAAETKNYHPLPEMQQDPDFNFYRGAEDQRKQEIRQLRSDLGFSESMFYYSGWAQAEILDRLYPDWKSKAFDPGVYLDELLKEVSVATTK